MELRSTAVSFVAKARAAGEKALPFATFVAYEAVLIPTLFRKKGELDGSWAFALHDAFARGRVFGRDVLFTFGPLGFLYRLFYNPHTITTFLATWAVLAAVAWAALRAIASKAFERERDRGVFLLALLVALRCPSSADAFFLAIPLLLLVHSAYVDDRPRSLRGVLLLALVSVGSLVKFTALVEGTVVVLAITVADLIAKRRPLHLVLYPALCGLLWLLAGQPLGAIPGYIRASIGIASGYNEAMSITGPSYELVGFGLGASALVLLAIDHEREGPLRRALPRIGGLVLLLWLIFKAGFTRHDGTHVESATMAFLVGAFAWIAAIGRSLVARGRWVRLLVTSFLVLNTAAWSEHSFVAQTVFASAWGCHTLVTLAHAALGKDDLRRDYGEMNASVRSATPLDPPRGSVDVYPVQLALIDAYGLGYAPRPTIQSYVAYTGALSERNARELSGPGAPDAVLFDVLPLDGRYPAEEDARSWPELLARYDVKEETGAFLVLERTPRPRKVNLVPIGHVDATNTETVAVPQGGPVWVAIDVAPNVRSSALGFVWKPPEVFLDVKLAGTALPQPGPFRLIPSVARGGFLLSPCIEERRDFAALAGSRGALPAALDAKRVESIAVSTRFPSFFAREIGITFYRLEIGE